MTTIEKNNTVAAIRALLEEVHDPEVPVLSVVDLGIIREVRVIPDESGTHESPATGEAPSSAGDKVEIVITPTYSGCPAMDVIRMNIRMQLLQHGYEKVNILTVLSPAWTTDWMSEKGKEKLLAYGIAPPNPTQQVCHLPSFHQEEAIQCPHCRSFHTRRISEFGSTACKALYKCEDCHEPFDYFKCH